MRALFVGIFLFLTVPAFACPFGRLSNYAINLFRTLFPGPDPNAPQSDRQWNRLRENWTKQVKERFKDVIRDPNWGYERNRRTDIRFLEENLGFEYDAVHAKMIVPPRDVFLRKYRELMERYVREGIVTPEEVLMPGSVYESLKGDDVGNLHIVPSDNPPKNGWSPVSPSPSPRLYTRMLKEGFHPFDDGSYHDSIGHMLGFARYPRYMAAMRKLASNAPVGEGKLTRDEWTLRYLFLLEGFSLMPASSRPFLETTLAPVFSQRKTTEVFTLEVENYYKEMPDFVVRAQAKKLILLYEKYGEKYAGSAMEIGGMGNYSDRAEMRQSLYGLTSTVAHYSGPEASKDPKQKEHLLRAIANLEVALWRSSFIPMEKFVEDFTRPDISRSSPVFGYFVRSGISHDVPFYSYEQQKIIESYGLVARSLTKTTGQEDIVKEAYFQDYDNLGRDKKGNILEGRK